MKTLIIYESIHHGNTERIGKKLAEILNADMVKANTVNISILSKKEKNLEVIGSFTCKCYDTFGPYIFT